MRRERKDLNEAVREYYGLERNGGCGPVLYAILLLIVLLAASCRSVEYVEVPVTHTEYVYRDRVDSLTVHDSIYIREYVRGDTVRVVEYRYRDRFRTITATDTLVLRDTVAVVREKVVVQTEHTLTRGQKALQGIGIVSLFFSLLFLLSRLRKIIRRF